MLGLKQWTSMPGLVWREGLFYFWSTFTAWLPLIIDCFVLLGSRSVFSVNRKQLQVLRPWLKFRPSKPCQFSHQNNQRVGKCLRDFIKRAMSVFWGQQRPRPNKEKPCKGNTVYLSPQSQPQRPLCWSSSLWSPKGQQSTHQITHSDFWGFCLRRDDF